MARLQALADFTDEVRRIGAHVAERQEAYAAIADSLGSLQRRGSAAGPESEAAFPPEARAPPSSVLAQAAYQTSPPEPARGPERNTPGRVGLPQKPARRTTVPL